MEENDYETRFIREEIGRCEDLEELKARIFPLLQSQQELWMQKMQEILAESGLTKSAFAKRCRVSRVSVDKWCKGAIPKNRETFLRIGMAAEYDLEKMNQLLRRYGQYPELYSKSLEDCVCIYVLNHRFDMDCVDNRESEEFDPDELCRYARKVLLELDLPEIDAFLAELPDLDTDIW